MIDESAHLHIAPPGSLAVTQVTEAGKLLGVEIAEETREEGYHAAFLVAQ
jgi:hypothetical protein